MSADVRVRALLMSARALVFDFDGVVLDSAAVKTAAFRRLFANRPDHVGTIVRFHLDNVGVSRYRKIEHIFANILKEPLDADTRDRLVARFSDLSYREVLASNVIQPTIAVLEWAASRGLPAYVASGTPDAELNTIVDARGLRRFFRGTYGSPRTKSEILGAVAVAEGLAHREMVYVGDGLTDMTEAQAAGVPFVGISSAPPAPFPDGTLVVTELPLP